MSLGTLLVIILIIFLLGGFSGRFGGPGYGYGHRGNGLIGVILIIVVVLLLSGRRIPMQFAGAKADQDVVGQQTP
jgi:hypothetical protein